MATCNGDARAVERVLNHRHVLDLFTAVESEPSDELVIYLGRTLREMWACKLKRDFPQRRFIVTFYEENVEDLLDYQVTFCQQ
ncbi:MAG: hypothetical protein AB7N71_02150 [Phycisphaerae bacterium]